MSEIRKERLRACNHRLVYDLTIACNTSVVAVVVHACQITGFEALVAEILSFLFSLCVYAAAASLFSSHSSPLLKPAKPPKLRWKHPAATPCRIVEEPRCASGVSFFLCSCNIMPPPQIRIRRNTKVAAPTQPAKFVKRLIHIHHHPAASLIFDFYLFQQLLGLYKITRFVGPCLAGWLLFGVPIWVSMAFLAIPQKRLRFI